MFQLYKKRNFSALINDTFTFFRVSGKNYFRSYLIINGIPMLALMVLGFLVFRVFFETVFTGADSPEAQQMLDDYFAANKTYYTVVGIICSLLLLALLITTHCFPVLYLSLSEKKEPTTQEVLTLLKKKLGKVIIFILLSLITFLPLSLIVMLFSGLMFVIIIGIPVAIILFAAFSNWVMLAFYDYLSTDNGFFSSLSNGISMVFRNFWTHTGSTAIMYIIISILQSVISFVPYFIGLFILLFTDDTGKENIAIVSILFLITFILYCILAFILGNIFMINQGLIYYSCREENEHRSLHSDIDLIGTGFE